MTITLEFQEMSQSKTKHASGLVFVLRFECRLVLAKSHSSFKANFAQSKVSKAGQIKWQGFLWKDFACVTQALSKRCCGVRVAFVLLILPSLARQGGILTIL